MKCGICKEQELRTPVEQQMQACVDCANTNGIVALPPPTRPNKPCATCGGLKFLRTVPREHSVGARTEQVSAPMMLTYKPKVAASLFELGEIDITRGWGWLEVYACYGCGRVEWFCTDVADIPIHPHLMTDVVDYSSTEPYR